MPSQLHESHLFLFRNQPALAAQLIRDALGVPLPPFREARVESADLTEVQPAEYRADLVIQLSNDKPVYGIIVEVQLSVDERKRFAWPAYVATLRARLRCPVSLLVVTTEESVARWAARGVEMGGLHYFAPYVLGPSRVPEIADERQARDNPELAVLSAMAHGRDANPERAIEIALAAQKASRGLDADREKIYFDLILSSLGEVARLALKNMDARTYEYQSDFARQYIAQGKAEGHSEGRSEGRAEGEALGRAALILRLLASRFGPIEAKTQSRIQRASIAELELIGERLLAARTLKEAVGDAA
ncbi:MAG: DUF4351 domain-containing protein [Gammaproteobacteria bacterium]